MGYCWFGKDMGKTAFFRDVPATCYRQLAGGDTFAAAGLAPGEKAQPRCSIAIFLF